MAPATAMDVALENGSPSSRRNKGKIAEAIQSMSNLNASMEALDLPTDPDAQATVTDFLDFTEYLPADMIRSLTLIRNLDETYTDASSSVNGLTKQYGNLPNIAPDKKPDPVKVREEISQNLEQAVSARTLAHAEACRMAENVDRHYNRAKNILAKLQAMAENYPPSREPSPVPQKAKSPIATRPPKIMLRIGGEQSAPTRVRKHRAPRITVPGEVLAPYELDYESYGSDSGSDSDANEPITPRATPGASQNLGTGKIKLKISKLAKKDKTERERPPRQPRPPGVMGTNVHSAVAGISTSNALAMLKPPPQGAVKGDDSLPWLQLNEWELAILRKRMKKNAIWSPSDTMISRELKQLGRGIEAYRMMRAEVEAAGVPYDKPEPPQLRGETVHAEGAISVEALRSTDPELTNRGMKLNQAKKLKKENLAKQYAEEAEASTRKIANISEVMKSLFEAPQKDDKKANAKTPSKSRAPARKRKRESPAAGETEGEKTTEGDAKLTRPPLKRSKTETPVPAPLPLATKQSPILPPEATPSISVEATPLSTPLEKPTDPLALAVPVLSPRKSTTPILPPTRELKVIKKETKKVTETATNTRPSRTSLAGLAAAAPHVPEPLPLKRPTSSRSKAASVEPAPLTGSSAVERSRRASTARNTPAPPEPRQVNKRAKRPAPGVVTTGSEGSASVSVGKRKAATRKKASTKRVKKDGREGSVIREIFDEIDDEGNVIDPTEPRYCLCNRVSFGTMIGCENHDCEKEWFHLECVALTDVPPRTTKWYCPECRVTLGIGEKGEVTARGKKK
ncbi:related to p33ING1b (ING1) protein [Rhynchosporium secalis]|uniref:Chromatin modification-related protein n=1 Tax=Rhynchosporium secalis TaxID=38038 RepID=A0A1E1MP24_RHYSE|nr:related to p33ING1b (ING1) protein [Rhynchosporium secalis]